MDPQPATQDDDALEQRVREGDAAAFADFYDRHRSRLWRTARFRMDARLTSRLDPEDVLQESFLEAVKRLDHYQGDSAASLYVWIRMVLQQTLIDLHRRHRALARDAGREVNLAAAAAPANGQDTVMALSAMLAGSITSPSMGAARQEMAVKLEAALQGMEPIDREILALRHYEEMSNAEIAQLLQITGKAASIRYVRALRRLKDILSQWPEFADQSKF